MIRTIRKRDTLDVLQSMMIAIAGLCVIGCGLEVIQVVRDSSNYPWGWEEGGWAYENKVNYLITISGTLLFWLTSVFLLFKKKLLVGILILIAGFIVF